MAANLQCYSDSNCTQELTGSPYSLQIGALTGIDGTNGGNAVANIWVKNTGTILISNVVLTETSDTNNFGSYSLDGVTYNNTTITLGNMSTSAVVEVYVKVTVPSSTAAASTVALNFTLSGTHL